MLKVPSWMPVQWTKQNKGVPFQGRERDALPYMLPYMLDK